MPQPNKASLATEYAEVMPLTQLFKHLKRMGADNHVVEYNDVDGYRWLAVVKFAGAMCIDEPGERKAAVARLLLEVDRAMFLGNPDGEVLATPGRANELVGLAGFAAQERIDTLNRADFHARFERDKEAKHLRLFEPSFAMHLDEGSLPPRSGTFAVGVNALEWHQLLPCSYVEMTSQREGLFTERFSADGEPGPFVHETSREVKRGVALLYGALVLRDPSAAFMMED